MRGRRSFEGRGGLVLIKGGEGQVGQVNSCVETINPSCGGGAGGDVPGGGGGRGRKALGHIDLGVCYTRGAETTPAKSRLGGAKNIAKEKERLGKIEKTTVSHSCPFRDPSNKHN